MNKSRTDFYENELNKITNQNDLGQWFSNLSEVSNPTGVMQAYIEPLIITRSGSRGGMQFSIRLNVKRVQRR